MSKTIQEIRAELELAHPVITDRINKQDILLDAEARAARLDAWAADLYAQANAPVPPKSWPNAQAFMAEFAMTELAEIGLSTHPTIAALRVMLSTWLSTVLSDDPRVILGLDALESEQIIDAARRQQITTS